MKYSCAYMDLVSQATVSIKTILEEYLILCGVSTWPAPWVWSPSWRSRQLRVRSPLNWSLRAWHKCLDEVHAFPDHGRYLQSLEYDGLLDRSASGAPSGGPKKQAHELEALLLDDLADESALDAIGLDHDEVIFGRGGCSGANPIKIYYCQLQNFGFGVK